MKISTVLTWLSALIVAMNFYGIQWMVSELFGKQRIQFIALWVGMLLLAGWILSKVAA